MFSNPDEFRLFTAALRHITERQSDRQRDRQKNTKGNKERNRAADVNEKTDRLIHEETKKV